MEGWIKLHRKLLNSPMYRILNSRQRDVMITCMLLANWIENEWQWQGNPYKCKPGQFITSLETIAKNCAKDTKVQSVRTALLKLEKWQFLTNESTKTGRLITILNWESYQSDEIFPNKAVNRQPTKNQQRANKELTTNKEYKESKEYKEKNNGDKKSIDEKRIKLETRRASFTQEVLSHKEYPQDMLIAFANWWSEADKSYTKMKFEKQETWELDRRLNTWASRNKEFIKQPKTKYHATDY